MKSTLTSTIAACVLTACAGVGLQSALIRPASAQDEVVSSVTTPATPMVTRRPDLQFLSTVLQCRIDAAVLSPERLNALLTDNSSVMDHIQLTDRSIYVMVPGFTLNHVAISHLVVIGSPHDSLKRALLAYSATSPESIRSLTGLSNQNPAVAPFMVVQQEKPHFAHGKTLTGFGCAMEEAES